MRNHKSQETHISMLCKVSEKTNFNRPFFWNDELERIDVYSSGYVDGLMKRDELSNLEQSILKRETCFTLRDIGTQTNNPIKILNRKLVSLLSQYC
ncbi:hypothetical protein N8979_01180 [bacterium]|mgnify:CR=1 FL=1|nr:hypothetical protein [bacterium]